jgi:hypothetical protein
MTRLGILGTGLALGLCMALFHAAWAALVALRWAHPLLDFIFRLHFITPPYRVGNFDPATALTLVGVTFALGAVGGGAFAAIWNVAVRK